jgi:hypothetical protein
MIKLQPISLSQTRCPYCHDEVVRGVVCDSCRAPSHQACWEEQGFCASCRNKKLTVKVKLNYYLCPIPVDPLLDLTEVNEYLGRAPKERWETCPLTWPKIWQTYRWWAIGKGERNPRRYCRCDETPTYGHRGKNHLWPCGWCSGSWEIRGCGKPIDYLGFCSHECMNSKNIAGLKFSAKVGAIGVAILSAIMSLLLPFILGILG